MFSKLRKVMAARAAARQLATQARVRREQRLARALLQQAQAAATVRQLALVEHLARSWLPARLRAVVQQALQEQLAALPIHSPGSPRSTGSSGKTARRSTSKRRRGR